MSWLQRFINETEMVSFSGFLRSIGWFVVVILFSVTASVIMLRDGEAYMTWGLQLALAVLGGLFGGSLVGAFNTKTVRTTAKEYAGVAEAKERGKVAGAAAAVAITEAAADARAARANGDTGEAPVVQAENVETVTVEDDRPGA